MTARSGNGQAVDPEFDVVICGGGLAGLTLARQLRRELSGLSVAVVERSSGCAPEAAHKVGESTVEVGSQYLERLGLREYLLERHIVKFGLRFFPGGGHLPVHSRTEIGPSQEPPVRSYQLDRGRFENDLRKMNIDDGVTCFEGVTIREVELVDTPGAHRVRFTRGDGESTIVLARWVVDATGRNGVLRRQLDLRTPSGHVAHAGWFRVRGRLDVTHFVPRNDETAHWHAHPLADQRWRSTNHFMGTGYWVWVIPLSSGNTSVGLVVHDECHGFDVVRGYEQVMSFLRAHEPHLAQRLESCERLDFRCLQRYSHDAESYWSAQRWALVGEAGAFVDPLYSPGTDFIAFANTFTVDLIATDHGGGDLPRRCEQMNGRYRAFVAKTIDLFRDAAPVYGHARAMAAKIYFDNFGYWAFMCQYFQQRWYLLDEPLHERLIVLGLRLAQLSHYVQRIVRAWAELQPEAPEAAFVGMPRFPSLAVDAYLDLQRNMAPDESLAQLELRVEQAEAMAAELVWRVAAELGLEATERLCAHEELASWCLPLDSGRANIEELRGVARRRASSQTLRDVERHLGRARLHRSWRAAVGHLLNHIGNRSAGQTTARAVRL